MLWNTGSQLHKTSKNCYPMKTFLIFQLNKVLSLDTVIGKGAIQNADGNF